MKKRLRRAIGSAALAALSAEVPPYAAPSAAMAAETTATDPFVDDRARMVDKQMAARGVRDPRVLAAMRKVPRHELVPAAVRKAAYLDSALPLTHGQTISQPHIVAVMSELAALGPEARVLEIGTGSGYQTAVLAELVREVYSIEIVDALAAEAAANLTRLGYDNVRVRRGDGYRGWPERAPFDAILVTAAPPTVPPPLRRQLAVGGRLVIPVGDGYQELRVIERGALAFRVQDIFPVRFVPMTGAARGDAG